MIPLHKYLQTEHTYDVIEVEGDIRSAYAWCKDSFGDPGSRWFMAGYKFYFANEKDAMWFELKF